MKLGTDPESILILKKKSWNESGRKNSGNFAQINVSQQGGEFHLNILKGRLNDGFQTWQLKSICDLLA